MNPNLRPQQQSFTYKDLLLWKLNYVVFSSVASQLFILVFYVFLIKADPLHPLQWCLATLATMTSFSTWIYMIPFLIIIFGQTLICAKAYVLKSSYCSTRFQKFVATFSAHNLVLTFLHVTVGATLIWLFLSVSGGQYQNLTEVCKGQVYCLNEGTYFLILSGFWTGFYYFVKVYIAEKNLSFPVVFQRKFLHFKSQLGSIINKSVRQSFWPSFYFSVIYYFYGETFRVGFSNMFGLIQHEVDPTFFIYFHLWFFTALYYFNMNLMRFYFNLFLTEPVQFPLFKNQMGNLQLQESINNYDYPIVQNLACLDLYLLAQWQPDRRQVFYTLSNPGQHPHNWNSLVENVLKLLNEYTELLNKTIDLPEPVKPKQIVQAPSIQGPDRFRNLRNMALVDRDDCYNYVNVQKNPAVEFNLHNNLSDFLTEKLTKLWNFIKLILGINFLFGELPQANVRKCLANGNLIIWASQGIADITAASLEEDKYGIVQKDLPIIISGLVNLKQSLDKLNKIPALTRKMVGYDDFNYKMKAAVTAAVKRSLFKICIKFGDYMNDIPLSKEISQYLQVHIICKS
ncbi:nucleoporin NDC1 [Anthonomus grandis grandis]|uniref:nucleoporin NDC1 n=1 Tax=Anthonomus grandis grandis TaxID=2921223 RepID=UPI002165A6EC|nr:nucleoporin NDC1 [Anthonomus grandis grandis]